MNNQNPILLFDGDCKVCNFWIGFIKKRKPKNAFIFHSLNSEEGRDLLADYKIPTSIDSIVFIKNNKAFIKSNAALQIINQFSFWWRLLGMFWIIPKPIRDFGYDFFAKNRHRFFVTKKECDIH